MMSPAPQAPSLLDPQPVSLWLTGFRDGHRASAFVTLQRHLGLREAHAAHLVLATEPVLLHPSLHPGMARHLAHALLTLGAVVQVGPPSRPANEEVPSLTSVELPVSTPL